MGKQLDGEKALAVPAASDRDGLGPRPDGRVGFDDRTRPRHVGASIHDRSEPSTQRARIAARPSGIANVGQVLTSRSPTIHFIAPGATHVTMVFEKSPLIGSVVVDLLDAKAS
jgi:hypothetical protein